MITFEAEQLGQRFGRRVLFRNLSFTLEAGSSLAVTGANGSGKSTLLRILAGLMEPTKGRVTMTVDGRAVPPEERPLLVGFVAPYLNVYDDFTARENLAFLAKARRLEGAPARIEAVLDLVALADRADERVKTYSSGMKQRVKYAAALLAEPPLLMLDEPSSNLDAAGIRMVERVMDYQLARHGLLLVATNIADEAARCARQLRIEDYR